MATKEFCDKCDKEIDGFTDGIGLITIKLQGPDRWRKKWSEQSHPLDLCHECTTLILKLLEGVG